MRRIGGERLFDIILNIAVLIIVIITIYPLWYVLIASISSPIAISSGEVILLPKGINVSAYKELLQEHRIWIGYRNSIIYTTASVILDLLVTIPCAFALSRKRLPFRKGISVFFTFTMYFGGGVIPEFILYSKLGLVGSPLALIIPACVNVFYLIVARNFFESSIPESLFDAARIDGAGYIRFFTQIVLPLSTAIIAVIALFCIESHWNSYLGAKTYIYDPNLKTLQQVIQTITAHLQDALTEAATTEEMLLVLQKQQLLKYSVVVVSAAPLVIIYPFVQKYFVRGIMVGAVKG